jgi:hypothetical protein
MNSCPELVLLAGGGEADQRLCSAATHLLALKPGSSQPPWGASGDI